MTKLSKLAYKQIEYLFDSNPKALFEKRILNEIIFSGFQNRGAYVLCTTTNIAEINNRINEYNIFIIGIQTDIEDNLPLYTFNVEDYSSQITSTNSNWINVALADLLREHRKVWLRFYINISVEQIEILMLKTGIPFI